MISRRKKDYQKKNLSNPFFSHKKSLAGKRGFSKLKSGAIAVTFLTVMIFLFTSDYFSIKDIVIAGYDRVSPQEIETVISSQQNKKRLLFFNQKNIFLFDKKSVIKELMANPLLESVKINRNLPGTLKIMVTEKTKGLIWALGNQQYYLDLSGVVIRAIDSSDLIIEKTAAGTDIVRPEAASGNYPLVYDLSAEAVTVGQSATSANLVKFVLGLAEEIKAGVNIDISHFNVVTPYFPEVTLITKDGWEVRFKISDDYAKQVRILDSVLEQEVKDRNNLEYIDLRFGEKVFYK